MAQSEELEIEVVKSLTEDQLDRMARYTSQAFYKDNSFISMFLTNVKDYEKEPEPVDAYFRGWLSAAFQDGIIIANKPKTGFRCLYGPDQQFNFGDPTTEKGKSKHLEDFLALKTSEFFFKQQASFGASAVKAYGTEGKALKGFILCVDPQHHHKGIGKALQGFTERLALEMKVPVTFCCEPYNLAMYQRRGYQSVLKDTLKTDDGEEGDLFWLFMDPGQKSKE